MRFVVIWTAISVKTFHNIFSSTDLYNNYIIEIFQYAIYTIQAPASAYKSQSTACGIKLSSGKTWIGVSPIHFTI